MADYQNNFLMRGSPLALLMSGVSPADMARMAPQFVSQAMRPAPAARQENIPPSHEQMGGGGPPYQPAGTSSGSPMLDEINKLRPAGQGFTLEDIANFLRNLQGPSNAY